MDQLSQIWYTWGSFLALAVALLAAFWVFFDAQRKQVDAVWWRMFAVLAVILILPSALISLIPSLRDALVSAQSALALLGIAATVLALLALLLYVAGVGVAAGLRCANCGRPRDITWPYCPFCEYDKPSLVAPPTPVYQPLMLSPQPPSGETMQLSPSGELVPPPTPFYQPTAPSQQPPPGETMQPGASGAPVPPTPKPPETRMLRVQPTFLAYLVIRSGIHEGKTFQLSDVTNIGRQADTNDIVLDDDAVSRQHARVRFEKDKFVLFDLASSNGTFIQDRETAEWKKIQQRALADGMRIKIGETVLSFMEVKANGET